MALLMVCNSESVFPKVKANKPITKVLTKTKSNHSVSRTEPEDVCLNHINFLVLAPKAGIEPATNALTVRYSTTELLRT